MSWTDPHTYRVNKLAGVDVDMNEDVGGNLTWLHESKPGCRRRSNNNQTLANGVMQKITFNLTDFIEGLLAQQNGIVITRAGLYMVGGCVHFNSAVGGERIAVINRNDDVIARDELPSLATSSLDVFLNPVRASISLDVNDVLTLWAFQSSGAGLVSAASGEATPVLYCSFLGGS